MYPILPPPLTQTPSFYPQGIQKRIPSIPVKSGVCSPDFLSVKPTSGHVHLTLSHLLSTFIVFSIWEPSLLPAFPRLQVLLQKSGLSSSPSCIVVGKGQGKQPLLSFLFCIFYDCEDEGSVHLYIYICYVM